MSPRTRKRTNQGHGNGNKFCFTVVVLCVLISAFTVLYQNEKLFLFNDSYFEGGTEFKSQEVHEGGNETGMPPHKISKEIKAISILGERNSGTTWMYEHMRDCFSHSIPVRRRLTRYKHWFQDETISKNDVTNGTLVLAIFRNPFEWVEAMRARPHHASEHTRLEWKEFVTKPWTMERVGLDLDMTKEEKNDPYFCQENFRYSDIRSCHTRPFGEGNFSGKPYMSDDQPFYEMRNDGSGKPFRSILEMRAAKNINFLSVKEYTAVKELWILQYEALLRRGTSEIIHNIERLTGSKAACNASPPQTRRGRQIVLEEMEFLKANVKWEAEKFIGYSKTGLRLPKNNSTIFKKIVSS